MEQHNSGKPEVDQSVCVGCRTCAKNCAHGAISFGEDRKASIDHSLCVGCGRCVEKCPSSLNIVKVIKAFEKEAANHE